MINLEQYEVWFVTGSQHLYGPKTLEQVAQHSREIAATLSAARELPVKVTFKPVLTTPDAILSLCLEANAAPACVGVVTWMHTFSPAKMWIAGLLALKKPLLHLHTQFNAEIPWSTIDMDFMNLNQSAHGDREFGFINTRLRRNRKVVVGHWQDPETRAEIGGWARSALAWADLQGARIARLGDNMREVAVTEGDKVEAQIRLGVSINGYGVGDLVQYVNAATEVEIQDLLEVYHAEYAVAPDLEQGGAGHGSLREAARIEVGLRKFLSAGGFKGFTTTFEDLHGLHQLPGLAVQRLMAEGYGFGAEGDWKASLCVRALKVMNAGLTGGTSFMEDYTYHFGRNGHQVLGAHMLEICPTIAGERPRLEVHPLGIGGKADPARLVFDTRPGPGVNATLVDLGNRFRLVVNPVEVVAAEAPLPKLPVARAVWVPQPNLKVSAAGWIYAGGSHHPVFSQAVTVDHLRDFAEIADIEFALIDASTNLNTFKQELQWNDAYYLLRRGLA